MQSRMLHSCISRLLVNRVSDSFPFVFSLFPVATFYVTQSFIFLFTLFYCMLFMVVRQAVGELCSGTKTYRQGGAKRVFKHAQNLQIQIRLRMR